MALFDPASLITTIMEKSGINLPLVMQQLGEFCQKVNKEQADTKAALLRIEAKLDILLCARGAEEADSRQPLLLDVDQFLKDKKHG